MWVLLRINNTFSRKGREQVSRGISKVAACCSSLVTHLVITAAEAMMVGAFSKILLVDTNKYVVIADLLASLEWWRVTYAKATIVITDTFEAWRHLD